MATDKKLVPNIDSSDNVNYPNGRIKDNDGTGNGTPVNRLVYGDLHEFFGKLMRLAKISYNGLPDNESNGHQLIQALQALANKNDLLATLTSVSGVLQIASIKLSTLVLNETLVCKAAADYASQTTLSGSEAGVTLAALVTSVYKANDYLKVIRTNVGVTIIRMATADNLNVLTTALNFLKAASNAQAITGVVTNVAVTPAALLAAFTDWVNGVDSASYLATTSVNGLMSKTDKALLNSLSNPVKNVGWVSGIDIGGDTVGSAKPAGGDITGCTCTVNVTPISSTIGADSVYRVTMAHAMANTNYAVRIMLESQGNILTDNNCRQFVFRPISTTQFDISGSEAEPGTQSLKIHLEVVQLS